MVGDETIKRLAPLMESGKHDVPGFADYFAQVTTHGRIMLCSVFHKPSSRPILTFGVCLESEDDAEVWKILEAHYKQIKGLPVFSGLELDQITKPAKTPWLGSIIIFGYPEELSWIADFEKCMAWTWLLRFVESN